MTKDKKGSKLTLPVNEEKDVNIELRNKKLNIKEKKRSNLSQSYRKASMEQKTKRKQTKNIENVPSKLNSKKIYDHQIQRINLILKQSLICPTLTEDELKILFVKYKLDGHYRTNKNLPPFSTLMHNMNNTFNGKHNFYDETKQSMLSNMQEINCENNNDYNRTTSSYDMEAHSNANIFNCTENFDEFKSCSSVNEIPNIEEQQYSCNLTNMQSVLSEECQSYGYTGKSIFYNASDSNAQHENLINCSEMSQQNDIKHAIHLNDLPLNSNPCNDFHVIKQNNASSWINRNNIQSRKSVEAVSTSYANTLESHYNAKNSSPYQYALVKSHFEEQSNCNSHARTSVYHLTNNERVSCIPNNSNINAQQNLNSYYTSNSTVASDNFFPQINTLIPSYTSIANQHL